MKRLGIIQRLASFSINVYDASEFHSRGLSPV